jgi:hypothetical protein
VNSPEFRTRAPQLSSPPRAQRTPRKIYFTGIFAHSLCGLCILGGFIFYSIFSIRYEEHCDALI